MTTTTAIVCSLACNFWQSPKALNVHWKNLSVSAVVKRNVPNRSDEILIEIKNKLTKKIVRHKIADDYGHVSGLYLLSGKYCDLFFHADRFIDWQRIEASGSLTEMKFPWYSDPNLPDASIVPYVCGSRADSLLYSIDFNGRDSVGTWRYYEYDAPSGKWRYFRAIAAP